MFALCAANFKSGGSSWLDGSSCVREQCPSEDEHVQKEVHALLYCQDPDCELIKVTPFH